MNMPEYQLLNQLTELSHITEEFEKEAKWRFAQKKAIRKAHLEIERLLIEGRYKDILIRVNEYMKNNHLGKYYVVLHHKAIEWRSINDTY